VVPEAVVERAAYIYRKSIPLISARGRSITTLVAAALYAACRSTQTPRTLKDIGDAANLDRLDIARSYRLLTTENELLQPVTDPSKSLSRIAYGARLSTKVERRGLEILKKAEPKGALTGNSPMGLSAASLYIASVLEGERSTKTHLAMVAGVTNVTIRNWCKVLISILSLDPVLFDDTRARRKAAISSALSAKRGSSKEPRGLPREGSPGQPIPRDIRKGREPRFRSSAQDASLLGLSDWAFLFSLSLGGSPNPPSMQNHR
jgi:hypothetical protein